MLLLKFIPPQLQTTAYCTEQQISSPPHGVPTPRSHPPLSGIASLVRRCGIDGK